MTTPPFAAMDGARRQSSEPMQVRATLSGDTVEVKILFKHPMSSNLQWQDDGRLSPPHFIKTVRGTCNGRLVLLVHFSFSVSRDPFFSFKFKGGERGQRVTITWLDTEDVTRTDSTLIL